MRMLMRLRMIVTATAAHFLDLQTDAAAVLLAKCESQGCEWVKARKLRGAEIQGRKWIEGEQKRTHTYTRGNHNWNDSFNLFVNLQAK